MVVVNVLLMKAHFNSVFDKEEIDGDLIDNHADEVDDIGSADAYIGAADDDDGGVEADGKGHCCTAGGGRRDRCSWDPGVTAGGDNACHGEEDEDKVELKYVDVLIIIFMHPILKMW